MSNTLSDDVRDLIEERLRVGKKIKAIKLYREHTGLGLKEAKVAVGAMQKGLLPPRQPVEPAVGVQEDRKAPLAVEKGCLVIIAMLTTAAVALVAIAASLL